MFRYAFKRTSRNWKLFAAVFVGVLVASTLFAASNVGANDMLTAMLEKSLEGVSVDMYYEPYSWMGTTLTSASLFHMRQTIEGVTNVVRTETLAQNLNMSFGLLTESLVMVAGIQANSTVYDGLTHIGGATSLGVNDSYLVVGPTTSQDFPIGSNYSIQIVVGLNPPPDRFINVTLHVVGEVKLTDQAHNELLTTSGFLVSSETIFIVDLQKTFLPLLDYAATFPTLTSVGGVQPRINIWVDRAALINIYDMQESMQAVQQIQYQLQNIFGMNGSVTDQLFGALNTLSTIAESYRWAFLSASMPVFFIAIYIGITLNDVSFSLRRREVGLLLTKGFTRAQITGIFVAEAVLVGLLASGLGLLLAVLAVPFFLGITIYVPISLGSIGVDTIFLTFIFGVVVAAVSTYWPARRASQIPTTEALREYTLAGEPTGYRKLLAWTCLILGGYKLVVWALGINVANIMASLLFTNPILGMLTAYWAVFDEAIGFWAPLLFLWGFATILVKGSSRFLEYAERFIHRVLGDLGGLAAHTIRRRPGRTAAVIFIAALLVGYSVQTVGVLATTQDLAVRGIYKDLGADIRVTVRTPENVTDLLPTIRGIDGVRAAAGQYDFTMYNVMGPMSARAINVTEWLTTAYFEPEWFLPGVSADRALQALADDNQSIILERLPARQLGLDVGSDITVHFSTGGSTRPLRVVGLFGPEPTHVSLGFFEMWSAEATWSYVSVDLLHALGSEVSSTGYILVALKSSTVTAAVTTALRALAGVADVESAAASLEEYNSDVLSSSTIRMMQMGVIFAFILASIGVLVVVYLTLRERRLSTALMSARGTTYGQTVVMLLAESLTMMLFAIIVGLVVGVIILYGLVKGASSTNLLAARFLPAPFLPTVLLQVGAVVALLLLATLVPILIEARSVRHDLSILR